MLKNLPAVRKYPQPSDDEFLLNLLENSKAPAIVDTADPPTYFYRVYFVAAFFLTQLPVLHELEKAEQGVTFAHMYTPIRALFSIQRAKDSEMGLAIPEGMEADPCVLDRCAGSSGGAATGYASPLFGTRSVSRVVVLDG